ncbi:squamosa promoter-binding-like protein 3 isoform X2 [Andrographis paniculata]|uniref:squamosa promoter-binding-like protein 3 isoform X2 n=1 Tax=Andrographis paniculata TaxID=175694 RepID=UPI0021E8359E|nr:squamosa promoter-binding-like protein 3 isoform X2 [Andrographis paniculata]
MSQFSEMEWNPKWDWDNFVAFGSKTIESPKKVQLADWMIVDDAEIDAGSFNLSAGGGNSAGSDGGHVSSAKSSISASTDSSTKDGMQTPNFRLMTFDGFSGNFTEKMDVKGAEISGTSKPTDASVASLEPLIGLKLGKRTYFENTANGGNGKTASFSVMPTPSANLTKKTKSSAGQNLQIPRCLVEGCNVDLSTAKEYHRKHRVCDAHSKCPKVVVAGVERRFCQQCSRFHSLAEFDEKKRSCRRRLSDHNARRRKPPQEAIQFNSARLSSPYYGRQQPMSFLLNNGPYIYSRNNNPGSSMWNRTMSKFSITKGFPSKSDSDVDGSYGMKLPHGIHVPDNPTNGFLGSKSSNVPPEALNPVPGLKGSSGMISISSTSNIDDAAAAAALDYRRALSLLSSSNNNNNTCSSPWGSESESIHHHNPPPMHEYAGGVVVTEAPLSLNANAMGMSDVWLQSSMAHHHHHLRLLQAANNFQEIQLLRTPPAPAPAPAPPPPYEADFYSNLLN